MTITDTTMRAQTEAIAFDIDLNHAPEKVWRAITEPALLTEWLLPVVEMRLTKGAEFVFKAPSFPGWDGTVNCRMLEVDEPRKISYSWIVGDMELDTVVTFTLTPTATGTRLSLVQSGFKPSQAKNWGGARYGWKMMGGKLIDLLARTP